MSNIKNKQVLYVIVRIAPTDKEAIICVTKTLEYADELCARYIQEYKDRGITGFMFYVQAQTYYDY